MKLRTKILTTAILIGMLSCGIGAGLCGLNAEAAPAATSVTAKCLTYGETTMGTSITNGCPDKFSIYMYGSDTSVSSMIYNNALLAWSYYNFMIEPDGTGKHLTFRLVRDGYIYANSILSGNEALTLYEGALPDGAYELEYTGKYLNVIGTKEVTYIYKYRFEADKTAPTCTLKAGETLLQSGDYTNQEIVYSAKDAHFSRIRCGRPQEGITTTSYTNSYTVAAEAANNGWWDFYAIDSLENTSAGISVYLDTIAPAGKVTVSNGMVIENGGYTNQAISYTATDTGGISCCQVKKPSDTQWIVYTPGTSLSGEYGWYTFRAVDLAGNISDEYKVYYDHSQPTGTVYGGTGQCLSGDCTNAGYVKYVAYSSYSPIESCYVMLPGTNHYTTYISGSRLTEEGTYYFYCKSKSGMPASAISITLDKTKPVGVLYGGAYTVVNGGYTNAEYIQFLAMDITKITTYVKRPGESVYVSYTLGTKFTEEGTYSFYACDAADNVSDIYTITLDRQIPAAQLYVDDEPIGNNGYTNGGHIRFECEEDCYVKLPSSSSFVKYLSGVEYYKPGKYVFYGQSKAGNSTGDYTLIIDRTIKTLDVHNVQGGITNGDVVLTWTDGDPETYAPIQTITVNGKSYKKGALIYTIDTGVYKISVTDAAGNTWETEFVSEKQNVPTKTLQQEYYEAQDANGKYFSFASYDNAFAFAAAREKVFVRTGEWNSKTWDTGIAMDNKDSVNAKNGTYFIYKKSGNPKEEVAYFTEERLNEVIAEYAKVGIKKYYYWEKEPAEIAAGENLFEDSDAKTILASSVDFGGNIACLIDGEPFVGFNYEVEGRHVLTVCDAWGNTCDYTLIVIRRAPEIRYAVGGGNTNPVTFERTYYFKDEVRVLIADEYDKMAMFVVYDENGAVLGKFGLNESFILTESGAYTVEAINHFGSSETFTLVISREPPRALMTENVEKKNLEITITKSADTESHIQSIEIYKSTDNGKTWKLLEQDDYGRIIAPDTFFYAFRTSGLYKVVVTDEFRTGIDAVCVQLDYLQPIPEGKLTGVENSDCTNGVVSFEWTDEAKVSLEKDGKSMVYVSGQALKVDGRYVLTFENYDGYKMVYEFVIDTIAPQVTLEGVENNGVVNDDVKAVFTEKDVTSELFRDGVSLGAYTPGTLITDSGEYVLIVSDPAGNKTQTAFTIDKVVDYEININDKGLSNSVIIVAKEEVKVSLTKDGEAIDYILGGAITEPGNYTLYLTDDLNNCAEVSFVIVKPRVKAFVYTFERIPGFEKVFVNGEEKSLDAETLELTWDGTYEIGVRAGGKTYTFTVTVDTTAPILNLKGVNNGGVTIGNITLSDLSEKAEVKVYLNGEEIGYKLGDKLTKIGKYKVSVTDEVGNETVYDFEIVKSGNGGLIVTCIVAFVVIAAIGTAAIIILRKKRNG